MIRIDDFTAKTSAYLPAPEDRAELHRAYVYAATVYRDQFLPGGMPLLQHALEVSDVLADLRLDADCLTAGLLHEALAKGLATPEALREVVGEPVVALIQELTKLGRASYRSSEASRAEHTRQMILSTTQDVRVILILLADRLQTMRTLAQYPAADRQAIARETLHIYAPIAHRLGIHFFLAELEDLAFQALEPETARALQAGVDARLAARRERIDGINADLGRLLAEHDLNPAVFGRTKHLYSIHKKLRRLNASLDEIYDLLATRVIVDTTEECYRVLGLIHAHYTPMPGRFKDYIAIPKENGYQSLHTTVIAPGGEIVEIQIRTRDMHRASELGIAAHFHYKDGGAADERELAHLSWFRRLLETLEAGTDPGESMELLARDLHPDEIFVFTPAGEVIKLPARATAIDFAYAIHSDVGNRCTGARMDGRIVPIRAPLQNGAVVEIITSNRGKPKEDWLQHAVTSKAVYRIRAFLRQQQRELDIELGRERVTRELKRIGCKVEEVFEHGEVRPWLRRQSLHTPEDLFAAEGGGKLHLRELIAKLDPSAAPPPEPAPQRPVPAPQPPRGDRTPEVQVSGMRNVEVRFARCCSPRPGDPLAGIVTRGHAISVHHRNCGNLRRARMQPGRLMEAEWVYERPRGRVPMRLVVSAESSTQGLMRVVRLLEEEGTPIESGTIRSENGRHTQRLTVMVANARQAKRILQRLNAMAGIRAVREVASA